jgi:hypothetical protein
MFSRNLFPPSSGLKSVKLGSEWVIYSYEEHRLQTAEGKRGNRKWKKS